MKPTFFAANRDHLMDVLQGGLVVLSAYTEMQSGNDTSAIFEQESNFWWLCGIEAADWWLIIDGSRHKTWLVSPHISENHEIFDGSLSDRTALGISGADAVITASEATSMLREFARRHSMVYTLGEHPYAEYLDFTFNPGPRKMHELLERTFNSVQDCRPDITTLRAIKQPEEISAIKKAVALTVSAFDNVKQMLPSLQYEYEIEAEFTYDFRRHGARGHAYEPIVASGKNACTLHYTANTAKLRSRQLVLLDIGARHHGYAADITRTYAFGEPTKRQKDVHHAVQSAHSEIIGLLKPGIASADYHHNVDRIMKRALTSLGLLKDDTNIAEYRKYFPHAVSHGLGIDVHDNMGAPSVFQDGMVLTVEPGIYIPEESIGVRIEDDILITKNGSTNLSGRLSTEW
jgi:Xaa-Pro aminopeptidase